MALLTLGAMPKLLTDTVTASLSTTRITFETRCITATNPPNRTTAGEYSETLLVRAETITPLLEQILKLRPPPHWGINE